MSDIPILFDVSRLIWRQWTGRLPTGIDRVCLAYLQHFQTRALAVVQFRGFRRIFDRSASKLIFDLLLSGSNHFRWKLVAKLAASVGRADRINAGQIYLNVGHTGLNSPHIGPWLARQRLQPVFLIHDLIPITHPQYCREGEDARHKLRMETALRSARGLILNSAATKRDLADFANEHNFTMPPSLIAWLGIDTGPASPSVEIALQDRPYFVMIGTIEARKNHLAILEAWREVVARLGSQAPDLIIIGQRGWEAAEAFAILDDPGSLKGHVHEMARCDDELMSKLLAGARAMLMPSFVEGFGLPVVEALQQGVPVIASDILVFREIADAIPTYVDPKDRTAWANAVIDYSGHSAERQRQLAAASEYEAPDWRRHFALVDEFLETL
jgi:glycosyltransferase involved in cell wall biosynthesis